ncbi:MAG: DUF411 domain-containing protein [Candidatus Bipolaricaulia bacterium]
MKNRKLMALIGIIFATGIFLFWSSLAQEEPSDAPEINENKVTVYKSPYCGCCDNYVIYLEEQGFQVKAINTWNLSSIKEKYQIPPNMQSCHTSVIGGYFIEGHVPIEAIEKLLAEKPDIDGIALPGMPVGSPGMPGLKTEAFKIYAVSDGTISEFMSDALHEGG